VVVLKDQKNKKAHAESAQIACEAAGAIRTVASLTREEDCCKIYSESLEEPLRRSNRSALWSNMVFAFSQSVAYVIVLSSFSFLNVQIYPSMYVIATVFWYGSRLVSTLEYSNFQFFVGLMVRVLPSGLCILWRHFRHLRALFSAQYKLAISFHMSPTYLLRRVLVSMLFNSSTPGR